MAAKENPADVPHKVMENTLIELVHKEGKTVFGLRYRNSRLCQYVMAPLLFNISFYQPM